MRTAALRSVADAFFCSIKNFSSTVADKFHAFLLSFWVLYCVLHSVMAAVWFKETVIKITGRFYKYYRLFYSIIAASTLIALVIFQYSHESRWLYIPSRIV